MSWNYRVVRLGWASGEFTCQIHEVYYHPDGALRAWSAEPVAPHGETPEELCADLARMAAALERPVLEHADLPGAAGSPSG